MTEIRFGNGQPLPEGSGGLPDNPALAAIAGRVIDAYPQVQELQDEPPQGTQPQEGDNNNGNN